VESKTPPGPGGAYVYATIHQLCLFQGTSSRRHYSCNRSNITVYNHYPGKSRLLKLVLNLPLRRVLRLPPRGWREDGLRRLLRADGGDCADTSGALLCGKQRPPARRRLRFGVHKEQVAGARMGGVAAQGLPAALRRQAPAKRPRKPPHPPPGWYIPQAAVYEPVRPPPCGHEPPPTRRRSSSPEPRRETG
jgi:hypothetical protein